MSDRRKWYTGIVLVPRTALRTLSMFRSQGLARLWPFLVILLLGSAVLGVINTVAPLAPFIYSLF